MLIHHCHENLVAKAEYFHGMRMWVENLHSMFKILGSDVGSSTVEQDAKNCMF